MVAKLSLSCRQAVALCELTRLLVSDFFRIIPDLRDFSFFGSYRIFATFLFSDHTGSSRLNCTSRQVVACVCCFLRFCIKPMRYIYHPQLDCYLVAINSDCSCPCELTLRFCSIAPQKCFLHKYIRVWYLRWISGSLKLLKPLLIIDILTEHNKG